MTDLSRRGLPRLATAPGLHDARFSDARGSKAGGLEAGGHNARAGTSLTPYGMSFWALILAACGGGGGGGGPETAGSPAPEEEKFKNGGPVTVSSPTQLPGEQPPLEPPLEPPQSESRSGHVYDGPVKGARVYVDSDGDGELNTEKDHFVGTTDGQGWFTGSVPANLVGRRYIVDLNSATDLGDDGKEGGTGVNADRTLQGTWLAPKGASVVSALTHLIATGVMTKAQIQSAYPDFDPLVDNPYTQAAAALPPEKQQAFEKIRKALPTITRLVEENRDLINQNSDRIEGLETTIESLEQKVAVLQTKLAETLETPPPQPVVNPPENPVAQAPDPVIAAPGFTSGATGTNLTEIAAVSGARVYDANATVGAGSGGSVRFSLKSGAPNWLSIDSGSGVVTLNRAVDLDATGETSRQVHFTVVARDSADGSRATEKTVSFTITNSDERPASMTVRSVASNAAFSESVDKAGGLELARVSFRDNDNPEPAGQNNSARVSAVSGSGHSLGADDFTFRNGSIYLNADADTAVSADATVIVTVTPVTSGHGTEPPSQSFAFTITNDPAPVVRQPDPGRPPELTIWKSSGQALVNETVGDGVTSRIDTRIGVQADPSLSLEIKRQTENGSWVVDDRFKVSGNRLWVEADKKFNFEDADNPNGVITLQITASDAAGNDVEQRTTVQLTDIDERPTDMALDRTSHSLNEGRVTAPGGIKLATVRFDDPDRKAAFLNNEVEIHSIDSNEAWAASGPFEIRNRNELWLKTGVTLDYERTTGLRNDHLSSYTILLRHKTDGTRLDNLTFTLNITNQPEAPVAQFYSVARSASLPSGTLAADRETGIEVRIYDPDSINSGNIQEVAWDVSDARFKLVAFVPSLTGAAAALRKPGAKYYKLVAVAGATFNADDTFSLTIKGVDAGGLDSNELSADVTVNAPVADPPRPNPEPEPDAGPGTGPAVAAFRVTDQQSSYSGPKLSENVGTTTQSEDIYTGFLISIAKTLLPAKFLGTRGPDGRVTVTDGTDGELNPSYLTFTTGRFSVRDERFMLEHASSDSTHQLFFLNTRSGAAFDFEQEKVNSDGKIAVTITFTDRNGTRHTLDADPDTPGDQPFLVAIRNEDEKPTGIALKAPDDDSRAFTGITINEQEPTTERKVADIDINDDGIGTNYLDVLFGWGRDLFEIRNGTELWLKAGQVVDRPSTGTHEVAVGLTDRTTGHGTNPREASFTVTINDMPEAPRLVRHGTPKELPSRTGRDPFDTGLVFILSDPDNLDSGPPYQDVTMLAPIVKIDGVIVSVDFFELVEDTGYNPQGRFTPGEKKYTLMVKAGQDLSDLGGRSVNLTIKGRDNSSRSLESNGIDVTLNVAAAPAPGLPAARVPTTPETPDTHDGQTGAPDIREVDTIPGNAASADRINNLESDDKIRINLEYVLLKVRVRTIDDRLQTVVDIFSPHDLTLEDNYLATVFNPSYDVTNGIGAPRGTTYFTTRAGDGTTVTKAYHLVEANERNASLSNNYNRNDAFVIDTTPSDESDAVKITNFRPGEGDALVFTGSDIYWQVKYDAGGFGQTPSYKLVFYSTGTVQTNNVLAVLDGYIHEGDDGLVFVAPTDDLFLGNKPNLHVIPIERKHYDTSKFDSIFSQLTGRDEPHYILQPLEGVNFVTDYFNPLYSRFISGVQIKNNEPARITNFEDGRDKILLDVGEINKYWWKETSEERPSAQVGAPPDTIRVIELYNTQNPTSEVHKIARILDFDGDFSHDDFIHADGTAVNSGQIIEIL